MGIDGNEDDTTTTLVVTYWLPYVDREASLCDRCERARDHEVGVLGRVLRGAHDGYCEGARHAENVATAEAARLLGRKGGQSRSPRKAAAVRANGARGGAPVLMLLVDDLGREIGITTAAPGRAGEVVEYGSRIARRQRPDGYVEPPTFIVEGRARLTQLPKAQRDDAARELRRWDVQ